MAESVDYDYDVQDTTLDGLLILPCYGSMTTGNSSLEQKIWFLKNFLLTNHIRPEKCTDCKCLGQWISQTELTFVTNT